MAGLDGLFSKPSLDPLLLRILSKLRILKRKPIFLKHRTPLRNTRVLRPRRRHPQRRQRICLIIILLNTVPPLAKDVIRSGISGPTQLQHLHVRIGVVGPEERPKDIIQVLRVVQVAHAVIGLHIEGLAVQRAPGREDIAGVAGGVVVRVWEADVGHAGGVVILGVAVGDFDIVERGEACGAAVAEEVREWAGPFAGR